MSKELYIKLDNDQIVNMNKLNRHTECYHEKDGILYEETISGVVIPLGKIIKKSSNKKELILSKRIAIDYDGTITESAIHPPEPPIREDAKKYIKLLAENGYTLYLWTARNAQSIKAAYDKLKEADLYKYFSEPESRGFLGKIRADFYIDDKSIPGEIKWNEIYDFIIKNIK